MENKNYENLYLSECDEDNLELDEDGLDDEELYDDLLDDDELDDEELDDEDLDIDGNEVEDYALSVREEVEDEILGRCPICGSTNIEDLDRGKVIGGVVGGIVGYKKRPIYSPFMPTLANVILGYAVGNIIGKALDNTILKNRRCEECGHEWHED